MPKILNMFELLMPSGVRPSSFIHGLENIRGEYHRLPITKVSTADTSTAQKLISGTFMIFGFNVSSFRLAK